MNILNNITKLLLGLTTTVAVLFFMACGISTAETTTPFTNTSVCSETEGTRDADNETATYTITFTGDWQAADHAGINLPGSAHFTALIGAVHNSKVALWKVGDQASPGVEQMAETGGTSTLENEIATLTAQGNVKAQLRTGVSGGPTGSATINTVEVSKKHSKITISTMLAPSPDWFVGVSCEDLYDDNTNQWKATYSKDLFPYSAGTESAQSFTLGGTARNPHIPIYRLTGNAPDNIFTADQKLATIEFTKQ